MMASDLDKFPLSLLRSIIVLSRATMVRGRLVLRQHCSLGYMGSLVGLHKDYERFMTLIKTLPQVVYLMRVPRVSARSEHFSTVFVAFLHFCELK